MNKVPDRAKLRREYVAAKWEANVQKIIGFALLFGGGIPVLLGIIAVVVLMITPSFGFLDRFASEICFGLICGSGIAILGYLIVREGVDRQRSLLYAPPVYDQLLTLAPEEVLLRGSQASAASPEELLRPVGKQESVQEELLRAATGGEAE